MTQKISFTERINKKLKPEVVFLTIGLLVGILLCVFLPYGFGIDEETHLIRIFDISGMHLIPNRPIEQGNYTLSQFQTMSYMSGAIRNSAWANFTPEKFLQTPNWQNMDYGATASTYLPVLYLPQALIAGISWRLLNLPILPVIIVMRLVGLLLYLLACFITIRLLPFGKWVFLVLALAPQALLQASTLNGDGFTNAVCFLFIGLTLNVYVKRDKPISQEDSLKLAGAVILLGLAKPFMVILIPLLLILLRKERNSWKPFLIILSGVVVSLAISFGWSNLVFLDTISKTTKYSRSYQIMLALNNLGDFLQIYFRNLYLAASGYFTQWVGVYKSYTGQVPLPVYFLFVAALLFAFFAETRTHSVPIWTRIFVSVLAIGILFIIGSESVLVRYVPGVQLYNSQGRYFLPYAPLLFLAWAGMITIKPNINRIAKTVTIGLVISLLVMFCFGAYRTVYSVCLHAVTADAPCTLPLYQDLDVVNPSFLTLDTKDKISQTFIPTCGKISNIQIRVNLPTTEPNGNLQLSIFNSQGTLERKTTIPFAQWQPMEQIKFSFEDLKVEPDASYQFSIALLPSKMSDASIGILAIEPDDYTNGSLLINGDPSSKFSDLFFEYECVR